MKDGNTSDAAGLSDGLISVAAADLLKRGSSFSA